MRGSSTLKRLDRYVGIPLVALLGPLRRLFSPGRDPVAPRTIGVIKEAAIGDVVVLAAALDDLRAAHPASKIILFAGPSNVGMARMLAVPDEVECLPLHDPIACIKLLRARQLDLLYDAGQWPRINALLCIFSGARRIVGFKTPRQHRHFGYDVAVEHRADLHEVLNFRRLMAHGDCPESDARFALRYDRHPVDLPTPYVVLHQWPGGERSELKEWPQENWVEVATHLLATGRAIALTGAPADRQRNEDVMQKLPRDRVFNLAGSPLAALPSLLETAELVVSVNTGLMHLAAVMGVPTIGLHGPTSIARWGPYGAKVAAIASRDPASQYLSLGFEYPANCRSMANLALDDAEKALHLLLSDSSTAQAGEPSAVPGSPVLSRSGSSQ